MKVLMIANCPQALDAPRGGVEAATVNLLSGLSSLDVHLRVVSFRRDVHSPHGVEVDARCSIRYEPLRPRWSTKLALLTIARRTVRRLVAAERPELVHVQGSGTQLLHLFGLAPTTTVVTPHAILRGEARVQRGLRRKAEKTLSAWIDDAAMRRAQNVIHISEYSRRLLEARGGTGVHSAQIYNAVDRRFFATAEPDHAANRLLFVGALTPRKNVHTLLESVRALAQRGLHYGVDLVGDSDDAAYRRRLQAIADELDDGRVAFHGWQDQQAVRHLMQRASLFVLPSRQETLPVALAEAMAAGLVPVAAAVGGVEEMISGEDCGRAYDAQSPTALEAVLVELHDAASLKTELAARAQTLARQRYHPDAVAERTLAFYRAVLAGAGKTS